MALIAVAAATHSATFAVLLALLIAAALFWLMRPQAPMPLARLARRR